jgi:hypothetical protein
MSNLKSAIAGLAEDFAAAVVAAIRSASLEEILEQSGGARGRAPNGLRSSHRDGRRMRRTAADIASAVDAIEALLVKHPSGLRAEQIRKELGLEAKYLPRPLAEGVSQKRFSKEGQKRATTYFAKGGSGAPKAAGSGAKKGSRRGKRRSA